MHHCCSVYSISCTGSGWLNELGHWITGTCQGRFQDFKLGGALKKIAPSEGRREMFWVFRVKNHDFTPKNHIFSNFRRARAEPPLGRIGQEYSANVACFIFKSLKRIQPLPVCAGFFICIRNSVDRPCVTMPS